MPPRKNYEGCNHHLTPSAIIAARKMSKDHGTSLFNPRAEKYSQSVIRQLTDQGFLMHGPNDTVKRNLEIIGRIPLPVKRRNNWMQHVDTGI